MEESEEGVRVKVRIGMGVGGRLGEGGGRWLDYTG